MTRIIHGEFSDTIVVSHRCTILPDLSELLRQYFNIAFLMGKPQDLPAGFAQMRIGLTLALVTYVLALVNSFGIGQSLLRAGIDIGCSALALYIALQLVNRPGRFEQAFGGLCGASAFINATAIPVYLNHQSAEVSATGALAEFVLLVWSLSLLAHVVRHTFEIKLLHSVAIAFFYVVVLMMVMSAMFTSPMAPGDHEQLSTFQPLACGWLCIG
ncbi:MAG: hypothetical protein V3U76_11925 [Granulosicoccus sp.]